MRTRRFIERARRLTLLSDFQDPDPLPAPLKNDPTSQINLFPFPVRQDLSPLQRPQPSLFWVFLRFCPCTSSSRLRVRRLRTGRDGRGLGREVCPSDKFDMIRQCREVFMLFKGVHSRAITIRVTEHVHLRIADDSRSDTPRPRTPSPLSAP
jgi:hypothetical protein